MYKQFIILFSLFCFAACQAPAKKNHVLPQPQKNKYAGWFKVYKEENCNILVNYLNTGRTDSVIYVLYSSEKPAFSFPAYYIKTPVSSVACMATVFVGALDNLQKLNTIKAVDNADYICNPFIAKKCAEGGVQQLAKTGALETEQAVLLAPQVIFTNPSGDKRRDFDERLIKANIIPVVCADYYENLPLARAEWIKAIALFFNAEQKADSLFTSVETNYLRLKAMADTCKIKPLVLTELKTGDTWFVPGGKSNMAQLLKDAGARYVFAGNEKTASLSLNFEQVFGKAHEADYWINLHQSNSIADVLKNDKRYESFKAVKEKRLYNNNAFSNATGGNAYWEYGLNRPDELLADLIKIVHPALLPNHQLKYYKQLK